MNRTSEPSAGLTLGQLGVRTVLTPPETTMTELEASLRADPQGAAVLTVVEDVVYVLTRDEIHALLSGRLGFGRALLHRRPLRAVLHRPALVLPADTSWDAAAQQALNRPTGHKAMPVVVAFSDGTFGVAPVGPLVEHLTQRYASLALWDSLTGLGNRRQLGEVAAAALDRPAAGSVQAALFVLDLDRFKDINDALGHHNGDALLCAIGEALQRASGGDGHVFRFGGDEFAVLIDDFSRPFPEDVADAPWPERLVWIGHRILDEVRGPFHIAGVPIAVEASVGVAYAPDHGNDLPTLLARADTAMYSAKRHRTAVECWRPELTMAQAADLHQQAQLRAAVTDGELVLHYQPLVDATTHITHSVEALVRWQHPSRGLLPPGAFLDQAERSDVITALTDRVLDDAVEQAARWYRDGTPLPVAVNLAAPVLAHERILAVISDVLRRHALPPSLLRVEVTESAVMTRPDDAARRLAALRDLGVGVAVDDFGTGYTSLALLTQLPIDELKLDRSFITRVDDRHGYAIVEALARMANRLGLTLVGEGVEDQHTGTVLRDLGFDLLQGYHFARPAPASEVTAQLRPMVGVPT